CVLALACSLVTSCSHETSTVTPTPPGDAPAAAGTPVAGDVADCRAGIVPGAPIDAPADTWTWIPIPEAKCRDGSSTGIGVRMHPGATQLAIYLEGGGACFHDASCAINDVLASFDQSAFNAWAGATG